MRFTMVSIGSTGDVRPYVLLGRELKRRGHEVRIACFAQFEDMVMQAGLDFYPLSGDIVNIMGKVMQSNGLAFLQHFETAMKADLPDFMRDLQTACADADALICTFFGSVIHSIAEKQGVPCIQTQYFPMDINESTPITCAPGLRVGRVWNKTTYKVGYVLINSLEWRYLKEWRRAEGMRRQKIRPYPDYTVNGHHIPVLYAMSPILVPRPLQWNEHIHMTGFWVDSGESNYQPDPELEKFLAEGDKPVYIGFGSMVSGDMGRTLAIVLEAIRLAGVRAVIARGWGGGQMPQINKKTVFVADYIPHDWLFPRVAAVVHHGGAGTTAAGILAGRPTLVVPFGGDQPFWGHRMRLLGVGPKPIRRDSLNARRLAKALRELVGKPSYAVAARELGQRMKYENGTQNAADIIEREIAAWPEVDKTE